MTFEQQTNSKAISLTLGIHAALLIFFILFKYSMPIQRPIEELGLEVNLGTAEDGFGVDQPELRGDPASVDAVASAHHDNQGVDEIDRPVHVAEQSEGPSVNVRRNQARQESNAPTASDRNTARPREARFQYAGSAGQGGNNALNDREGGDEGIGTGTGDMGVPGGTPGASNYSGTPGSGNLSYSLNNRTLVSRPEPEAVFKQGGKVVVNVTVNPEGGIIRFNIRSAPNGELRRIAEQKLKSVRFSKAANAKPEEFGTITFDFK